jgi:hypothetical protein
MFIRKYPPLGGGKGEEGRKILNIPTFSVLNKILDVKI